MMDWSFVCWRQCHPRVDSVSVSSSSLLHRRSSVKGRNSNPLSLLRQSTSFHRRVRSISNTKHREVIVRCTTSRNAEVEPSLDCVGTGQDVECVVPPSSADSSLFSDDDERFISEKTLLDELVELGVLVSPFFFWGTAMVAMKEVLPKAGPFFVSSFRLVPAGFLLIAYATSRGRKLPSGLNAWLSITLFGLVDASCFLGFLAEGLQRTSAGLGSVIIDSQPLTVAILAAILFGESIGGLIVGVVGLLLLEAPATDLGGNTFSLWGSGEWWMLLAAQSMAVSTVMVRWVQSILTLLWPIDGLSELSATDVSALLYTSIFGSAISYGVYFNSATKGSLTKLSSLTFLTPMFASIFGYLYLNETFSPLQLFGAAVTLVAIYMVNYKKSKT